MYRDAVELTQQLVAIDSVSRHGNAAVSDLLQQVLEGAGFELERLEYDDPDGVRKVNLIGRRGTGSGGFGLFSHSDTVPGDNWTGDPFSPHVEGDRLVGLGSCDMKGPAGGRDCGGGRGAGGALGASGLRGGDGGRGGDRARRRARSRAVSSVPGRPHAWRDNRADPAASGVRPQGQFAGGGHRPRAGGAQQHRQGHQRHPC